MYAYIDDYTVSVNKYHCT